MDRYLYIKIDGNGGYEYVKSSYLFGSELGDQADYIAVMSYHKKFRFIKNRYYVDAARCADGKYYLPGFPPFSYYFGSTDNPVFEFVDVDDFKMLIELMLKTEIV